MSASRPWVRFCRSMGYDGLSDFKLKLAGTVSEGVPFIHRSVDSGRQDLRRAGQVIDNSVAAFLRYRNDASTHALERAVEPWRRPGRQSGASSSMASATPASWRRMPSTVLPPRRQRDRLQRRPHAGDERLAAQARRRGGGDLSNSGRTRDLMDAADIARRHGATVIVITASGSPLASVGYNIHLAADHPEATTATAR